MATVTIAQPHPILLAGRWVDSPDPLVVTNPADPGNPAGATYHATEAQYEEAVSAAVAAFEETRVLPAYERGRVLRAISAGIAARREELGALICRRGRQADPRFARRGGPGHPDLPARRRGGRADHRRDDPARPDAGVARPARDHPALPDRPGRRDQPVQLPAQPGRPQAVAGDRGGLLDRAQAAVEGPAHDAHRRRDRGRGRPAGGRGQHPADDPRARRPDGRGRAVQAADVHGLAVGRLADEGPRRQEERSCSSSAATPA